MAWSEEQIRNANVIATVGRQLGASRRDIVTALTAAIVESGLRNVNYGDGDSLGLFQQRAAWGSASDRTDPAKAAKMFFTGGAAGQRGLFDIQNHGHMQIGAAAQAVQVSAFPARYQQHVNDAAKLLGGANYNVNLDTPENDDTLGRVPGLDNMMRGADTRPTSLPATNFVDPVGEVTADASGLGEIGGLTGTDVTPQPDVSKSLGGVTFDNSGPSAAPAPTPQAGESGGGGGGGGSFGGGGGGDYMADLHIPGVQDLLDQATSMPADMSGAVSGWRQNVIKQAKQMLGTPYVWGGTSTSGVDCSGLMKLIFKNVGVDLPRISAAQANTGTRIGLNQLEPGDMVAVDNSSRNNGADHIALYIGEGKIIEAPHPGSVVQVANLAEMGSDAWGVRIKDDMPAGPGMGDWGVQLNVAAAGHKIANKFGITDVGGYSNRNIAGTHNLSDHALGEALDFMGGKQNLADYAVKNAAELNVHYVIYNHRIWNVDRADEGWRPYDGEDPHTSHVHVSFLPDSITPPSVDDTLDSAAKGPRKTPYDPNYDASITPIGWDGRYPDGGMGLSEHPVAHNSGAGSANAVPSKHASSSAPAPHSNAGAGSANAIPDQKPSKPKPKPPPRKHGSGNTPV